MKLDAGINLVPFCKFQNGYPPKWGYKEVSTNICTDLIFGYCSIFRGLYAIYGQYHHNGRSKDLVFGVIKKSVDLIIENAIYKNLEFYPNSSSCFIGKLNTNTRLNDNNSAEIFFNADNGFSAVGNLIIPIDKHIFAVINEPFDIRIFSINGKLIHDFPFSIDEFGNVSEISLDSYMFCEAVSYEESGFRLRFINTQRQKHGIDDVYFETYSEKYYNIDFNSKYELIERGINLHQKKGSKYKDLGWKPNDLNELSFSEVLYDLVKQKKVDSDKIYHPIFYGAKLYEHKSGQKYWETKFDHYSTFKKL